MKSSALCCRQVSVWNHMSIENCVPKTPKCPVTDSTLQFCNERCVQMHEWVEGRINLVTLFLSWAWRVERRGVSQGIQESPWGEARPSPRSSPPFQILKFCAARIFKIGIPRAQNEVAKCTALVVV